MKKVRCAIYTRKSSEEGLEQSFNSLDAQREACAAYVLSQASEGWALVGEAYDDGGLSGGSLDRPALQRLLGDIAAGKIDIVVVYKVDRLTRSLLDFAKLVEALDKAGTSFVSITQSFNTTTSMGRLTLNMLLSFAQFEREVTAERIRDKIAASKAKGMWMGGTPPLGYRPDERSLAIVEEHADLIRMLFTRYLAIGNVRLLADELKVRRIHVPIRRTAGGRQFGGDTFTRGQIYAILSNPIYIGRIRHRDVEHDGKHPPIVAMDLWNAVQARLADNRQGQRRIEAATHPSILAGKLFDPEGEPMIATHANKQDRRYRYYVSRPLQHGGDVTANSGMRLPAREIEALVCNRLAQAFDDPFGLIAQIKNVPTSPHATARILANAQAIAARLRSTSPTEAGPAIATLVDRIHVGTDATAIWLDRPVLARELGFESTDANLGSSHDPIEITVSAKLKRSGMAMRIILPSGQSASQQPDRSLIKAIARAHVWWQKLDATPNLSVDDLARREGMTPSYLTRILRLAFLDPAIVELILAGAAPVHLNLDVLQSPEAIPMLWTAQRAKHRIAIAA